MDSNLVALPQFIAKEAVKCLWLGRPCGWVNLKLSASKGQKGQWSLRDNEPALAQVEIVDMCVVNANIEKHSMNKCMRLRYGRPVLWTFPFTLHPTGLNFVFGES